MADPFLKWVGGKQKLLSQLVPLLPSDIDKRYYREPFLGGGALFFHVEPKCGVISDSNADLIHTYKIVRDRCEELIPELTILQERHNDAHYYRMRELYNYGPSGFDVAKAAVFIYLNKTCFNGVYRVNSSGKFNVPVGSFKQRPVIFDEEALWKASHLLQKVMIWPVGYADMVQSYSGDEFYYFDPPYLPASATANFTNYTAGGFSYEDHVKLAEYFVSLDTKGAKLMMSNCDHPAIRELYQGFNVNTVTAGRSINSDTAGRGNVTELVIRNYG